jgi:hypothetical protein
MANSPLTAYWIQSPDLAMPFGYGVTAFSRSDAFELIRSYGLRLPDDVSQLRVTENVRVSDLDADHVVPNIGPIVVRGVWFPFTKVGV